MPLDSATDIITTVACSFLDLHSQYSLRRPLQVSASYIVIQCLVIQFLQLGLVVPELYSVQHLCQQQNQSIFVPAHEQKEQK